MRKQHANGFGLAQSPLYLLHFLVWVKLVDWLSFLFIFGVYISKRYLCRDLEEIKNQVGSTQYRQVELRTLVFALCGLLVNIRHIPEPDTSKFTLSYWRNHCCTTSFMGKVVQIHVRAYQIHRSPCRWRKYAAISNTKSIS